MPKKTELSPRDAFRALRDALASSGDEPIPAGFKSVRQWAAETGHGRKHSGDILRAAHEAGKVERRIFRIGGREIPHYRIV